MENYSDFEQVLLDSISDNTERIQRANEIFITASGNPVFLLNAFMFVLDHSQRENVVISALINLRSLLFNSWEVFDDVTKQKIKEFILKFREKVTENNLRFYSYIVLAMLNKSGSDTDLVKAFTNNKLRSHYLLELLSAVDEQNSKFIVEDNFETVCQIVLSVLKEDSFYYISLAIKTFIALVKIFPSQINTTFKEHFAVILEIAKKSLSMPGPEFVHIWEKITMLFSVDPSDMLPFSDFIPIIFAVCEREDIIPEFKVVPLMAFSNYLTDFSRPDLLKIYDLSLKISIDYVRLSHKLPNEFMCFHTAFPDIFGHQMIYNLTFHTVNELLNSQIFEKQIVALTLIDGLIAYIPHKIYSDIAIVSNYLETSFKQTDPLYLEIGCRIITRFKKFFAWNLIDPEQLIQIVIPLNAHHSPSVRFIASEALYKCFEITNYPIPGVTRQLFSIYPQIMPEDMFRYLFLLKTSIHKQGIFEQEECIELSDFVLSFMDSSDLEIMYGTVSIAISMMTNCDISRDFLKDKVIEIIRSNFMSDDCHWVIFSTVSLADLIIACPQEGVQISLEFSDKIKQVIQTQDEHLIREKQYFLNKIAIIDSYITEPNHPFNAIITEQAVAMIESNNLSEMTAGLRTLKRSIPSMEITDAIRMVQQLAEMCLYTKFNGIATKIVDVVNSILLNDSFATDTKAIIYETAFLLVNYYIIGNMSVLNGVPPISTDIDFELLHSITRLSTTLTFVQNPMQKNIFDFFSEVFKRKNNLQNIGILIYYAKVIEHDCISVNERKIIAETALSLIDENIDLELTYGAALLILSLMRKDMLDLQIINEKIPVFLKWWDRVNTERGKLRKAMTSIILLIWTIKIKFPPYQIPEKLAIALFEHLELFDSYNTTIVTNYMISYFDQCEGISLPQYIAGALALSKLLIRSPVILERRNVSHVLLVQCEITLNEMRMKDKVVQEAINEFASKSESRKKKLQKFITI
ncbi:hypothetical protein TRFO_10295 [Tritrichomonas foetus]|uniref:Importin N-terminal domain-containing protein n=1 Tax=Tritrichomonas foetus TaxID=1144522 RepID=A0A1J4JF67_9EUKA|nr:hypothetical protein TRFO_10295 [Tritrichomonas foetus]|eukprot:OHS95884.1 hypothetical protein TRFO_10295 [Tritrichomonas foetus]